MPGMAKKQAGKRPSRSLPETEPIFTRDGVHLCQRPSRSPAGIEPMPETLPQQHRDNIDTQCVTHEHSEQQTIRLKTK